MHKRQSRTTRKLKKKSTNETLNSSTDSIFHLFASLSSDSQSHHFVTASCESHLFDYQHSLIVFVADHKDTESVHARQ